MEAQQIQGEVQAKEWMMRIQPHIRTGQTRLKQHGPPRASQWGSSLGVSSHKESTLAKNYFNILRFLKKRLKRLNKQ